MGISIQYVSPYGQTVTFNEGSPVIGEYTLLDYSDLDGNLTNPLTQKSPFQIGNSLIGVSVEPRVISMTVLVNGGTETNMHTKMKDLVKALAISPVRPDQPQPMGKLKATVNGATYEIDCIPQSSPQFVHTDASGIRYADMEFYCPYPYWRSATIKTSAVTAAGTNLTVTNGGDITIPCIIKIGGAVSSPEVTASNGQKMSFGYNIATGKTLIVDSHFGKKSATVDGVSVLSKMNFASSTFFMLPPGSTVLSLTSPGGNYGTLQVITQDEFSGIGA
jgi:hypothetical protein